MKLRVTLFIALFVGAAVISVSPPHSTEAIAPLAVDISNRQAVIDSYRAEFERTEPDMGFTGNLATCTPGTTSSAFQLSVLQRVNWYRQMAGLPDVSYNAANHAAAQAGALISAAQGSLSHTPSASAKCYSSLGYTGTSSSNLALGGTGVRAIDIYIDDFGDNNKVVGHRRWILSPELRGIATGDIPGNSNPFSWRANALFVFDTGSAVATRDGSMAWPPPGFVPDKVVYDRWSYVRAGANFTNAQVAVTGPNGTVSTVVESRDNFMGPGIVFIPTIPPNRSADTTYTVTITGVTGVPNSTISYNVTIVPINSAPRLSGVEVSGNRCSGKEVYLYPNIVDDDDDSITVGRPDESGDASLFTINKSGPRSTYYYLSPKSSLDPSRESYTFTFQMTDALGATRMETTTVNIPMPGSKTLCNPRSLSIKRTKSGTSVKWSTLSLGAKPTKFVARVGTRQCTTTKTSCVIKGLAKGRYTVTVTAYRTGSSSKSTTARLTLK